ncbi:acyltransferase [Hymenobacter caeli]|uniref:Acetyltransferase-like isoleucine patch superfamily enzyme n=1 Tax=Hymenobacter caeli TaxID=2735894 RepID=A0ABX2FNG2_9BACT|nr:acyltransferase [Hymenobacter caeli]NRT18683.1 acetyltransferase-like isoleucine patch superfamily enzyme [Hymenobacter caeli]
MKLLLKIISCLLPWPLRRQALGKWFGFELHPTARIGWAWVFPNKLSMAAGARIDHFTVAIHLDAIRMGARATIGRGNWITGFPTDGTGSARHFGHQPERRAVLVLGEAAAVTKNHHLDCTNQLTIGNFSTVAGYQSQFLTHSIDVMEGRQDSAPIHIGDYTFVGTNVVVLGGAVLPAYSVLGAKSLLNKPYTAEWMLYGGVPAKPVREISRTAKYFSRSDGFVY